MTSLSWLALLFSVTGLVMAGIGWWEETHSRSLPTVVQAALDRLRPRQSVVTGGAAAFGTATITLTARGVVGTGDPVLDRLALLEDKIEQVAETLQTERARAESAEAAARQATDELATALRAAQAEADASDTRRLNWEFWGLVLIGFGSAAQAGALLLS